MKQPVLVTGATGFIGRHLIRRWIEEDVNVRAFVLPEESLPDAWQGCVDLYRGDVADAEAVDRAMDGVGTVFHLAAVVKDWGADALHDTVTVGGTRHVLAAAARGGARAVLASSIVVYGDHLGRHVCDESTPFGRPLGPYSRSKQAQERIAHELAASDGLRVTLVRPANVFGPGSVPWVHEVVALLRRRGVTLIDGGWQNAGLCHVDNLVELLRLAATKDAAVGRLYNAVDGSEVTWKRYFTDLAELAGSPPPRSAPMFLARALAVVFETVWKVVPYFNQRPPLTREALNLVGSNLRLPIDRARDELGWKPSVTYEEAIRRLAEHVQ